MSKRIKYVIAIAISLVILLLCYIFFFIKEESELKINSPFLSSNSKWVDSLMLHMSIEQKIGSMIFFDAGKLDSAKLKSLDVIISKYHIGGVFCEFDSTHHYIDWFNKQRQNAEIPLMISFKAENSFPVCSEEIIHMPGYNEINSITDDSLIFRYSEFCADVADYSGISLNFFPQGLFNANPENISNHIIKTQNNNILSGSVLNKYTDYPDSLTRQKLNTEITNMIDAGISCLYIGEDIEIDSISHTKISDYIVNVLNFQGLTGTDISYSPESGIPFNLPVSDILITDKKVVEYINLIKNLISENKITIDEIDKRVRKILLAKSWAGLDKVDTLYTDSVNIHVNGIIGKKINRLLMNSSVILVKNRGNFIPVKQINDDFYVLNIGTDFSVFNRQLNYYTELKGENVESDTLKLSKKLNALKHQNFLINLNTDSCDESVLNLLNSFISKNKNKYNYVLLIYGDRGNLKFFKDCPVIVYLPVLNSVYQELAAQAVFGGTDLSGKLADITFFPEYKFSGTSRNRLGYTIPEEFGMSSDTIGKIDSIAIEGLRAHAYPGCQIFIAKEGKVIYHKCFGFHSYDGGERVKWDDLYDIASVTKIAATTLAAMKMYDTGKLSLDEKIEKYFKNVEIEYTRIKADTLIKIDTLNIHKVKNLAKMVKGCDTIHLNDSVFVLYDTLFMRVTPKLNVFKCAVKDMLIHQSGLPPSMPILRYIMYREDTVFSIPDTFIVSKDSLLIFDTLLSRKDTVKYLYNKFYSKNFLKDTSDCQIAENMYLRKEYEDTLWIDTKQIRVFSKSVYMYSDVNPIIVQQVIDTINDMGIDEYLTKNFYKPLGCRTICYTPRKYHDKKKITPTEDDKYWRAQLVHGYVHDPSAAMMGGIAGNAGLFSNAHDLGIIFQMVLNGGIYGGRRYIDNKTINKFTATQPESYRGLGFDKASKENINAPDAPVSSYGHTGFTGTCVWVDPENKLVYVFLSNRIHPSVKNWKLNTLEIRQRIHQIVYNAMNSNVN